VFTGPNVVIALKLAVSLVTALLLVSIFAIATGQKKLHGRINTVVFFLTLTTLIGFEVILRVINPDLTASFTEPQRQALYIHLGFSIPSALLLPVMMYTGITHRRRIHIPCAIVFGVLWIGTFVTGLMLPHDF